MFESNHWLADRLILWIPLLLSLTVHEWAHALAAKLLGDDTAERLGRLTLNPLEHIDPIGTLILPLLGVPFGWAKPVPIQPLRFRRDVSLRTGVLLVAAAGPASNLCLALALAGVVGVSSRLFHASNGPLLELLERVTVINVLLACFNLLPIPPLDGGRVVDSLMPERFRPAWDWLGARSLYVLAAVLILPGFFGFSLLAWPYAWAQQLLALVRG